MPITWATASTIVDLPLPFSPTRNVTLGCNGRVVRFFTTGSENGHASKLPTFPRSRRISRIQPGKAGSNVSRFFRGFIAPS